MSTEQIVESGDSVSEAPFEKESLALPCLHGTEEKQEQRLEVGATLSRTLAWDLVTPQ